MYRTIAGVLTAAIVVIAAGLVLTLDTGRSPQPGSQLVVQGRVTGINGKPVSGIKVWLNAWPRHTVPQPPRQFSLEASHQPVKVTVAGWVTTSAAGWYAIRASSPAALPQVATGVIKFSVMTGNSTGWATASFRRRLVPTAAGAALAVPPGGTTTADLHLKPWVVPQVPPSPGARIGQGRERPGRPHGSDWG